MWTERDRDETKLINKALRIIIDRVQIEQTQFSESQAKYYVRYQESISRQGDYDPEP